MGEAAIEAFSGAQLPTSWRWYFDADQRSCFSAGTTLPQPDEEDGYTHTLLFATHTSGSSPVEESAVLLGEKLRGFGKGTYNGMGGKICRAESARQGVLREMAEETHLNLRPDQVHFVGRIRIEVERGEQVAIAVYTTALSDQQRDSVRRSEEVAPLWIPVGHLEKENAPGRLEGRLRPEHKLYLALLLHHSIPQQREMTFDAHVHFHPECEPHELQDGQRPENHRSVKAWHLTIFHNVYKTTVPKTEEEVEEAEETSGSEASYGCFARREWG